MLAVAALSQCPPTISVFKTLVSRRTAAPSLLTTPTGLTVASVGTKMVCLYPRRQVGAMLTR